MLIVDSAVHIWGPNTSERPWPAGTKAQREIPLGADELLREMDAAGVDRVVIVPPSWEGERNDLALAAAQTHPDRFAVMGRLDPLARDAQSTFSMLAQQPGLLGFRFTCQASPAMQALLNEGRLDWIWEASARAHIPLYLSVPHEMMDVMDAIARRHPKLNLTLDHLGLTIGRVDDDAFRSLDKALALAVHPNVAVKASALPSYTTAAYPYHNLHKYLQRVFQAFGPQRMFWGTDFSRSPIPYRQHVTMFVDEMSWLSQADKEWIMGLGISRWLGWSPEKIR